MILTPVDNASQVIEANIAMEITPSRSRVVAALRDLGLRKDGTPLAIASMPVSAVVPDEKARATRNARARPITSSSAMISQPALSAVSSAPITVRMIPVPTMIAIEAMKRYVGIAKATPDSRIPRRLTSVMTTMIPTAHQAAWSAMTGKTDPRLATAAEMETATVRV